MADDPAALDVEALAAGYGGTPVVANIDLTIRRGEVLGLLGANGSGKSTLLRAVTGQLPRLAGRVRINGVDLGREAERAKAGFGFAVDPADLPAPLFGSHYLELLASIRRSDPAGPLVAEAIDRLGLAPWLDRPIAEYSLGSRAKLAIAGALVGAPPLLVFDESLNGLDPLAAWEAKGLFRALAAGGRHGVIVSTHVVDTVPALCTAALLLAAGRTAAHWDFAALQRLAASPGAFEAEVMAALRHPSAPTSTAA